MSRFGQKNGRGYYKYETDKKGRPKKLVDADVAALLAPVIDGKEKMSDEAIVDSMMIPMCLEAVRCLEDDIAASATDVDLSLIYGIGFPPFRGGALHYIDDFGIDKFVARADELAAAAGPLGAMYQPTEKLRAMAASGRHLFRNSSEREKIDEPESERCGNRRFCTYTDGSFQKRLFPSHSRGRHVSGVDKRPVRAQPQT